VGIVTTADPGDGTGSGNAPTTWVRSLATPLRLFVAREVGSALILLAATLAALVWANSPWGSTYEDVWSTEISIRVGDSVRAQDLRHWINDGLMTFFFLVVGLEVRREFDMGELRDRRRVGIPIIAGIGGMAVPALIYIAVNSGGSATQGWGVVVATDTAFALGILALVGGASSLRTRIFLLTLVIVDDVGALIIIAVAYSDDLSLVALLVAVGLFGIVIALRAAGVRRGLPYAIAGVCIWIAMFDSGVHPTVAGVALGLVATAYPPSREDLQEASSRWRSFREQPTPEYARSVRRGVAEAISPNERLQDILHPVTSFVIVPLFALANAGVDLGGGGLGRAVSSPITLGIVCGLVVGKLVGITGASWLATRRRLGNFPLTVPWPSLIGVATVAGIGFTVSLFIAELTFDGEQLQEAKIGILGASLAAAALSWFAFRALPHLPGRLRAALRVEPAEPLIDLDEPDPTDDHIRGPDDAPVTLVEYADFECPYCGQTEPILRDLVAEFGDQLRYVFRHLPLTEVHEHAQLAAEAAEAAGAQGKFWEMHDLLFAHQDALDVRDLKAYADELGLDMERFSKELRTRKYAARIANDVAEADETGVTGTPTFFVNGRRHHGAYDLDTLTQLVRSAATRR
jgi:Na+/H+ antiporter NhaA